MPDDGNSHTPIDRRKIEVNSEEDVAYWAAALHVTVDRLRHYVRLVGPMTADVRLAIAKAKRRDAMKITLKVEREKK